MSSYLFYVWHIWLKHEPPYNNFFVSDDHDFLKISFICEIVIVRFIKNDVVGWLMVFINCVIARVVPDTFRSLLFPYVSMECSESASSDNVCKTERALKYTAIGCIS